ncbi:hypothetical protein MKW94_009402 [Papaver nudicaule]|uniref:Uncharacterized protein n=1 Tax=Papaver nudicaule TaxID=74823 RepID=A0AA41VDT8_PAPNU|nr:hypothetical protein [Papaver nudicaule]
MILEVNASAHAEATADSWTRGETLMAGAIKVGKAFLIFPSFATSSNLPPFHSFDETASEPFRSVGSMDSSILSMSGSRSSMITDPLVYTKVSHVSVAFTDDGPLGKVKYPVTCYHAKGFEALRRLCCPSELDFIRSLSRSKKWCAQGGKTNAFFAKIIGRSVHHQAGIQDRTRVIYQVCTRVF